MAPPPAPPVANESTVTLPDGATTVVESYGRGDGLKALTARPGLIVVQGGAVTTKLYRRLATRLADRLTVHLYNRRGRPGGADLPSAGYSVGLDVADLEAVMRHTGATQVLGHSVGGFIALHAALSLPITKLALYDGAVNVDNLSPTDFLDDFEQAISDGDYVRAMAVSAKGLRSAGRLADLPMGFQMMMARLFLRTPIGKDWLLSLHTVPAEAKAAAAHGGPASLYSGVTAEVLLASGSYSPPYYKPINERLAAAIPKARAIVVRGNGHDGPNRAGPAVLEPLAEFFA